MTAEAVIRSASVSCRSDAPETTHRIEVSMHRILSYRSLLVATAIALAPLAVNAQSTAAITCKDGSTSSATGRGACSGHGGVDKAAAKAAKRSAKAAKAESRAEAKAENKAKQEDKQEAKQETKAATKATRTAERPASRSTSSDLRQPSRVPNATTANTDPTNATAKCKDGTYSHAATHRGACSRHGGVAEWLKS